MMYIKYEKLWKMLLEKRLTKTDLCAISGISTRTLNKLVKNQSVTTDTLIRICQALDCDLSEIMELCDIDPTLTLYDCYRQNRVLISEDEFCKLYSLQYADQKLKIKEVKRKSSKRSLIHCRKSGIVWEQFYPNGITAAKTVDFISDLSFIESGSVCILIVDGSNVGFTGLDEGVFLSASRPYRDKGLYVMSKAKFKLFAL